MSLLHPHFGDYAWRVFWTFVGAYGLIFLIIAMAALLRLIGT